MKARLENGQIKIYAKLPSRYESQTLNIAGGFHKLPTSVHETEGFYDVVIPNHDQQLQELNDMYFDDTNQVFTYNVINKVFPSLSELKKLRIYELKSAVKDLYHSIQWYVEMKRMSNESIPQIHKDKIDFIKTKYEEQKTAINALTTKSEVIKYQLPYDAINNLLEQLDNIE